MAAMGLKRFSENFEEFIRRSSNMLCLQSLVQTVMPWFNALNDNTIDKSGLNAFRSAPPAKSVACQVCMWYVDWLLCDPLCHLHSQTGSISHSFLLQAAIQQPWGDGSSNRVARFENLYNQNLYILWRYFWKVHFPFLSVYWHSTVNRNIRFYFFQLVAKEKETQN